MCPFWPLLRTHDLMLCVSIPSLKNPLNFANSEKGKKTFQVFFFHPQLCCLHLDSELWTSFLCYFWWSSSIGSMRPWTCENRLPKGQARCGSFWKVNVWVAPMWSRECHRKSAKMDQLVLVELSQYNGPLARYTHSSERNLNTAQININWQKVNYKGFAYHKQDTFPNQKYSLDRLPFYVNYHLKCDWIMYVSGFIRNDKWEQRRLG